MLIHTLFNTSFLLFIIIPYILKENYSREAVELSINYVDLNGEKVSQAEYCRRVNISYNTIRAIMRRYGLSFLDAIDEFLTPLKERKRTRKVAKDRRLRKIWSGVKNRCYNLKNSAYPRYGGMGVVMQDSWKNDYFAFENDLYDSYIEHCNKFGVYNTTLDRFPNKTGNYELNNVRWATYEEQNNNKTNNHILTNGLTVAQFSKKYNIPVELVYTRIKRGWTLEEVINPSLRKKA